MQGVLLWGCPMDSEYFLKKNHIKECLFSTKSLDLRLWTRSRERACSVHQLSNHQEKHSLSLTHTYSHKHICMHTSAHMWAQIHTCTTMHKHMYPCTHVCTSMHMCAQVYTGLSPLLPRDAHHTSSSTPSSRVSPTFRHFSSF